MPHNIPDVRTSSLFNCYAVYYMPNDNAAEGAAGKCQRLEVKSGGSHLNNESLASITNLIAS